jgi:hypothetical protein
MRKIVISFALAALFYALCAIADAQQPDKTHRVGFLSGDHEIAGSAP